MAIIATYKDSTTEVKNAYIRVERIWGCKADGWSAWVHVYAKEGNDQPAAPVFSVNAPYIEGQNPFVALYEALEKLPFIINENLVEAVVVEVAKVEAPTGTHDAPKKRSKKSKA